MNKEQLARMHQGKGFVAALDQSGGSTPKALRQYGIPESDYTGEKEMFDRVHGMRVRIITSPAFSREYILGAILFEDTIRRQVGGEPTADYLWNRKGIVPFLKVDKGLTALAHGVQLMRPIPGLADLLREAAGKNVFGTKMRSVILAADPKGIAEVMEQQFDVARQIAEAGLVPIIEPEVDINSPDRRESEALLKKEARRHLAALPQGMRVMFKFSIPVEDNFYSDLIDDERVVRIVALSGGYSRAEANERLARNRGLIASFSRALTEGLTARQNDDEFNATLAVSVRAIYEASVT